MFQEFESDWHELIIDHRASPEPVDDVTFQRWVRSQRVFVSSTMDDELTPYRNAVRDRLLELGAQPVMWETLAPRDQHPTKAFLDGVARSSIFVLMLGESYGVGDDLGDAAGFSPTHQEAERAKQLNLSRLMFTLPSPRRDGPLQRWMRTLYREISGIEVASPEDAVARLESRLRDMAAEAAGMWVKLGPFVFPGLVRQSGSRNVFRFKVTAKVVDNTVRHGLMQLQNTRGQLGPWLTWPDQSYQVGVESVETITTSNFDQAVEISCSAPDQPGGGLGLTGVNLDGVTPTQQAELWMRRAAFGETYESNGMADMLGSYTKPDSPTLPEVLSANECGTWQAEGVTRLYLVEGLRRRWGGTFAKLHVGPATDRGVAVEGVAVMPQGATNVQADRFKIKGVVNRPQ